MKIIKSIGNKVNFIAGVFYNNNDAEEFYSKISPEIINQFEIINLVLEFPFYIIEKTNNFEFLQKISDIQEKLNEIKTSNEEIHYFNIYAIKNDFIPENSGVDSMGNLEHFHINSDFFENYYSVNRFIKILEK